jgi:hypothetical protein
MLAYDNWGHDLSFACRTFIVSSREDIPFAAFGVVLADIVRAS